MKYTILTSFNQKYWDDVAKDNVRLVDQNWPKNQEIILYHQLENIDNQDLSSRVIWKDLYQNCPDLVRFAEQWKDNPRANGVGEKKNAFRWNAIKFAHKTFAIWHAAKQQKDGWLVWLDCDSFVFQKIDQPFLDLIFPNNKIVCYLGRKGKYSECGFMGFNLGRQETRKFLEDWENVYLSGEFIDLPETHDSWIFDYMKNKSESKDMFFKLNENAPTDKNPFTNSLLGTHMAHAKGGDKTYVSNKLKSRLIK